VCPWRDFLSTADRVATEEREEQSMADGSSSRLIIPALGPIYRALAPYTETMIRLVAGLSFVPHGYPKLFDPAASAAFLEESGYHPGMFWAVLLGCTETLGGLFLAAGLLTRVVCVPILIFLITAITTYHWPNGFAWNEQGFEYPLFWAIVVFHFLIHGGGPYSIDAVIGREV
jgi:putative oxidoreductase